MTSSTEDIYARIGEIEDEKNKILNSRSITSEEFVIANTKYCDLVRESTYLLSIIEARLNRDKMTGKPNLKVIR